MNDDGEHPAVLEFYDDHSSDQALRWWHSLGYRDQHDVLAWLSDGGVPQEWKGGAVDYAYTECPKGLFSGRWGRIL